MTSPRRAALLLALASLLNADTSGSTHPAARRRYRSHAVKPQGSHRVVAGSAADLSPSALYLSSFARLGRETMQQHSLLSTAAFAAVKEASWSPLPTATDPFEGDRKMWTLVGQDSDKGKGELRNLNMLVPSAGTFTKVIMLWHLDASWVKFDVEDNIFDTSMGAKLAIPLKNFETNDDLIRSWIGMDEAVFCNAVSAAGSPGASSWAIKKASDTNTGCGCSGEGNAGQGIFYGGFPDPDATMCKGEGGGFAGPVAEGKAKGGASGTSLKIYVLRTDAAAGPTEHSDPNMQWKEVCTQCTPPEQVDGGLARQKVQGGGSNGISLHECKKACEEDPDCNYIDYHLRSHPVDAVEQGGDCFKEFGGSFHLDGKTNVAQPGVKNQVSRLTRLRSGEEHFTGNTHDLTAYMCAVGWFLDTSYIPSRCIACPAGYFCLHEEKNQCVDGTFSSKMYQSSCNTCESPLTSESQHGHEECYCPLGKFGSASSKKCKSCPKGSFCQRGVRKLCAAESYSARKDSGSCNTCSRKKTTKGKRGAKKCVCKEGFYPSGRSGRNCKKCKPGYTCPGHLAPECPEGNFEMQTTRKGSIVKCLQKWPVGAWSFLEMVSDTHPHKEQILSAAAEGIDGTPGLLSPRMVDLLHGGESIVKASPPGEDLLDDEAPQEKESMAERGDRQLRAPFARLANHVLGSN